MPASMLKSITQSLLNTFLRVALHLAPEQIGQMLLRRALHVDRSNCSTASRTQLQLWREQGQMTLQDDGIAEYLLLPEDSPSTQPTSPPVLLVHGREGNAGQMAPLAAALRQRCNVPTLLFDFGSHGLSAGHAATMKGSAGGATSQLVDESSYPLLRQELCRVVRRHYGRGDDSVPHVPSLVVHSAGTAAVRMALHAGDFTAGRLVLLSPIPGSLREQQEHFICRLLGLPAVLPAFRDAFEAAFPSEMDEWDEAVIGGLPAVRSAASVLLVHGARDSAAPMALSSKRWAAAARAPADGTLESKVGANEQCGRVRFLPLDGVGHLSILADTRAIDAITSFIATPESRL